MNDFDIERIITYSIGYVIFAIIIILYRKKLSWQIYVFLNKLTLVGCLFLFIAVIINSLYQGDWSFDMIRNFLLIKKVGIIGFRKMALASYLLILIGITISLFSPKKPKKLSSKK
jgi:hypothetical protein